MHRTFLVVSDIHYRLDNIKKLQIWLTQKDRLKEIDYIIASGDLVNADYLTPLTTEKDEQEFHEVISAFQNFGKPLYYIPGNHDPDTSFLLSSDQDRKDNSKRAIDGKPIAKNFHNESLQLAPGLSIVGFGGSTEGVLKNSPETVIWPACPRNTETLLSERLPILIDQVKNDDIILVTHFGPSKTGTTDVDMYPLHPSGAIESGSKVLRDMIALRSPLLPNESSKQYITLNIHGHSHYPFGLSHIGQTMIVNPGALRDGRFAILSLSQIDRDKLMERDKERRKYMQHFSRDKIWNLEGLEFLLI
ncbi:Metallo-dependent phosphatase-like protein [Glomus cerebriforme]|uniref:Metallo-dependent phosphatase-like protein n=1 Tax=Glomus cerebriforme TaxID=658196 RepID=A0A397TU89_9GLOM|nr:Metallo-dependent phosphatase-like protein [Glomus cerebriforme]